MEEISISDLYEELANLNKNYNAINIKASNNLKDIKMYETLLTNILNEFYKALIKNN
jgi:hypothetical protein